MVLNTILLIVQDPNLVLIERYSKVETPIHDNIRALVTLECKEHGVKS